MFPKAVTLFVVAGLAVLCAAAQETPTPLAAQSPAQPSPPEVTQDQVVSLQALIREALQKNPGIQSASRQVEALRRKVPQAKALPDPTASVGWAGNIVPFETQHLDSASYRGVGASQTIPFPGKLKVRGEIADREAEAAWWDYEAARRDLVANVKSAYYDYYFFTKAIEITQKDRDLLEKFASIADARYRVGKAIQQDVIKSQVEISRLQQKLTMLEQQRDTVVAKLNTLLYRDPDSPLLAPSPTQQSKLDYSLDQLFQTARQQDTGLQREQRMIERNQYAVDLAHKDYRPDFGVSYMYQQRPDLPDMHGFTFSANIPIFYKSKQREAVKEATAELSSSESSKRNREAQLYFAIKEQYLAAKSSEKLLKLYSQGVVPQSSLALESSMNSYEVGASDFLTILTNFNTVLDYEVDYYRELANYQIALAHLEPLVGVELAK
jgi:outer membrane protein TolC